MKKLIVICLFCAGSTVSAQNDASEMWFTLNPEIGVNLTSYPDNNSSVRAGFFGGVNVRLGKRVWFQPGVQLLQHSVSARFDSSGHVPTAGVYDIKANYLSVPLLVGVNPVHTDVFMFKVYAGYVPSIFLGGRMENAFDASINDFNNSIHAIRGGVGIDVWRMTFNTNFDYGISDVYSWEQDVRYWGFNMAIGVKFY